MPVNSYEVIANWLDAEAAQVRDIEKRASSALYDDKDEHLYRELMRQKAILLASLADNFASLDEPLSAEERTVVQERVGRFSLSASKALEIGSVFFMSALLYPDDHKDGDKNDLESFAEKVRNMSQ
ncbi:hypothetical protein SAMN05660337_1168 [Maridesulfovibrio ferrireducens]|uniref:Uncharacterized protein n=1 Tax=Maridesulfovibrio ferrireducens TaxID=246191 RepID=A0A1G9ELB2_9BACT|nr:hypothetical protein [Maridesulfovibrio ferrireducens]SDK76914.1 hypothetical protein SAMN05660337_1168 [Maridesulfovibrio ferrireducens]